MKQLALVGCGHIHTPGFVKNVKTRTDVKVKSVWDHDAARAEKNAKELDAAVVKDLKAIYDDPDIAAILVYSETNRHEELVTPAAAAKKHLFVEKPLGYGTKDAYAMAEAIEKAGVLFQTGYFQRGNPLNNFIKKEIEKNHFGKITRIRGSNCHQGALGRWFDTQWRWMADPKIAGVGAFGDLGTHSLDIMIWLMGDVESVTAQLDKGTNAYAGCDETGEALLRFKSGMIGTLAAAWDDVANPVSLLISGTEGHATIINGQLHYQTKHVPGYEKGKVVEPVELPAAVPASVDAFLNAVAGKPAVLVGAREAAYRSAVMEAMYRGAERGEWVKVK